MMMEGSHDDDIILANYQSGRDAIIMEAAARKELENAPSMFSLLKSRLERICQLAGPSDSSPHCLFGASTCTGSDREAMDDVQNEKKKTK